MKVQVGERYRLKGDHGNEPGSSNPAFHPSGVRTENADGTVTTTVHPLPDGYPLRAGTIGTVLDVDGQGNAAATPDLSGVGNDQEDHAALLFEVTEPSLHKRIVSFTDAQLGELFELVAEEAE